MIGEIEQAARLRAIEIRQRLRGNPVAEPTIRRRPIPLYEHRSAPAPVEYRPKANRPFSSVAKEIIAQEIEKAGIGSEDFFGRSRRPHISRARQVAAYRIRQHTTLSMPQIAKFVGYNDHTTALHAIRKIAAEHLEQSEVAA